MTLPPPLAKPEFRVKMSLLTLVLSAIVLTTPITLTSISVYNVEQTIDQYVPARLRAQAADVAAAIAFATQSEALAGLQDTARAMESALQAYEDAREPTPAATSDAVAGPNTTLLVGQPGLGLQHASVTWRELGAITNGMCPFTAAPQAEVQHHPEGHAVQHTLDYVRRRIATHVTTSLLPQGGPSAMGNGVGYEGAYARDAPKVVVRVLVNASATAYFDGDANEAASTTATARLIADAAANASTTWAPACTYASGDTVVAVPIGGVDVPPDAGINISAGRWPTVTELTAQFNRDAGHHCQQWPLVPALERRVERRSCKPFASLPLVLTADSDGDNTGLNGSTLAPWRRWNSSYGFRVDPWCAPPHAAASTVPVGTPRTAGQHASSGFDLGPRARALSTRLRRSPYVPDIVAGDALVAIEAQAASGECFIGDVADVQGNVEASQTQPRWSVHRRRVEQCVLSQVLTVNRTTLMPPGTPAQGEDPSDTNPMVDVPLYTSDNRTVYQSVVTVPVTVSRRYALTSTSRPFAEPRTIALLQAAVIFEEGALDDLVAYTAQRTGMVVGIVDRSSNAVLACSADGTAAAKDDRWRVVSRPTAEGCGVIAALMSDIADRREVPSSDLGVPTVDKLLPEPVEAYAHLLFANRVYSSPPPCARRSAATEPADGTENWFVVVALPTRSYLELVLFTRARMVVTAFAVGAVSVILMLLMMRSLMHPLRALTRSIGCCASMQLDKMELMEASSVAEIAEIQKSVAYLAIRLYHYQRFLPDRLVLDTALADASSSESDLENGPMFARTAADRERRRRRAEDKKAETLADRFAPKRRKPASAVAQIEMAERQFDDDDEDDDEETKSDGSQEFEDIAADLDALAEGNDELSGHGTSDDAASVERRRRRRRKAERRKNAAANDAGSLSQSLLAADDHTDVDPMSPTTGAGGVDDADDDGAPVHTISIQASYETGGSGPAQMQRLRAGAHRAHRSARFAFRYRVTDAVHSMLLRKCRVHLNERPGEVLMMFVHTPDGKRQLTNNEDVLFAIEYFANQGDLAALHLTVMKASVRSMLPAMIALSTVASSASRLLLAVARMLEPDPRIQIIGVLLVACLGTQVAQNILVTAYLLGRFSGIDSEFREWKKVSRRESRFALVCGAFNVTNVEVLASHLRICGEFLRLTAPLSATLVQKIRKYSLMGFLIGDLIPFVIIVIETILRRSYRDPFVLTSLFFSVLSVVSILVRHGIIRFVMDVAVQRNKQSVRNHSTKTMILSRKEVSLLRFGFADEGALLAMLSPKEVDLLSEAVYAAASPIIRKYGGLLISTVGLTFTVVFNAHTVVPAHASAAYASFRAVDKELAKHVKPFLVRAQRNRHRVRYGAKIKFDRGKAAFRHRVIGSIVSGEMCLGYIGTLTSQSFQHVDEMHDLSRALFELNVRYGTTLTANGTMVVLVRTAAVKEPMLARRIDRVTMRITVPGTAMRLHEQQRRIETLRKRVRQQEDLRGGGATNGDAAEPNADEDATIAELADAVASNPLLSGRATAHDAPTAAGLIGGPPPDTSSVTEHDVFDVILEDLKTRAEDELEDLLEELGDAVLDQYTVVNSVAPSSLATTAVNRQRRKERIAGLALSSGTVESVKRFDKAMESLFTLRNPTEVMRYARGLQHDHVAQAVSKWARFVNALNETEGVTFPRPITVLGLQLHPCEIDPRITPAGAREGLDDTIAQQEARRAAVQRHLRPPRSERRLRAGQHSPTGGGGSGGGRPAAAGASSVLEQVIGNDRYTVDFVPRRSGPIVDL